MFVPFSGLATPPVQSAGRGRAQQRRGAHSTCKLILEMCARFLILKLLKSSHVLYIHICLIILIIIEVLYACFHFSGYIYVIKEMLNMIRMRSIWMIEDFVYIYIRILNCFYGELTSFH